MDRPAIEHRQLADAVRIEIARALGSPYQITLDALDTKSLRELLRLLRDLEAEKQAAARRAGMQPWRR
jgi:hypothetical protein